MTAIRRPWALGLLLVAALIVPALAPKTLAGQIEPDAPASLALVWTDTSRGEDVEVWVAAADGRQARQIASFASGTQPLALAGSHLALSGEGGLIVLDLTTGERHRIPVDPIEVEGVEFVPSVRGALFAGRGLYYATRVGCGPSAEAGYQILRFDLDAGDLRLVAALPGPGGELYNYRPSTNELLVMPRGCDIGIGRFLYLDIITGETTARFSVTGCGTPSAAPDGSAIIVPNFTCSTVPGEEGIDARLYSGRGALLGTFTAPEGAVTGTPFRISPDSRTAAYAATIRQGDGPGATRSAGLWLLDLESRTAAKLWQDDGAELIPVAWAPDGASILAGSVQAMGYCTYVAVDVATGEAHPIAESITVCGANGQMLGWTRL